MTYPNYCPLPGASRQKQLNSQGIDPGCAWVCLYILLIFLCLEKLKEMAALLKTKCELDLPRYVCSNL